MEEGRLMQPLISVVLPVYNTENYITTSIQSIINQSYSNFELIILDDGSTDRTAEIVRTFDDKRIRFIQHENMGMAATLNKGIQLAKGSFIARQDADDVSYPDRFEKQITFLLENPAVAMVGSFARIIQDGNNQLRYLKHPFRNNSIKFFLFFDNPFVHSSIMMRKNVVIEMGCYQINRASLIQDYDLWSKIADKYQVANLPEVLLDYREVSSGISQEELKNNTYREKVIDQSFQNLAKFNNPERDSINLLSQLFHRCVSKKPSLNELLKALSVLKKMATQIEPGWRSNNDMQLTYRIIRNRIIGNVRSLYYPRFEFLYYLSKDIKNKLFRN